MEAIVVEGLRKRYGDVQALAGVTFSVQEGEALGARTYGEYARRASGSPPLPAPPQ